MYRNVIAGCVVLAAASGVAQNLTEKIDVSLVNVDVTVASHGAPARGLTRDDFEVLEDGVPQTITHFYAIENAREKSGAAAPPAVAAVTPAAEPAQPVDERFRRKVMVIIDNRHLSHHNRDAALRKLEQFIDAHFDSGAYDWSIAMIGESAHMLLPLTADKATIHAALAEIRNVVAGRAIRDTYHIENRIAPLTSDMLTGETMGPASGGAAALNGLIEQSNRFQSAADAGTTYMAIREMARSFANAPGRKIILLLTGPFADDANALTSVDPSLSARYSASISSLRDQLVREANVSNVSVSVVNVEGLAPGNAGADMGHLDYDAGRFDSIQPATNNSASSGGSLFWIARQTGGNSYPGNFIDRSLQDFDVTSANFYSLAYRPNHGDDRKYHRITVRLKKPGNYQLTYRNGYSSIPVELQLERVMTSATAAEMQPSSIPLEVTTGAAAAGDVKGAVLVPFRAAVPAKDLQFLPAAEGSVASVDVFLSIFNDSGRLIRTFRTVRQAHAQPGTEGEGNFIETRSLRLRKGVPYRVIVAVHDQVSDAIGITSKTVRF
jgi:VWFA-related protein